MSDENCYILTGKMVQFVLIAGEAITGGLTGGKVGTVAVASYQKCGGKMISSMKLRTNVGWMLSTSSQWRSHLRVPSIKQLVTSRREERGHSTVAGGGTS